MAIDKIFNDANVDGIADNIFGAVNNSVSEVKQMQQRKAAENVQLVVEAFKKIETNITEKFDNVTDVIEKRVLTIKDGRDGSSGSDGRNGRDGKPGRDGVNGKQGTPGTPGKDGTDGVDGVSVTDASIDFDGSLVISLSSGQQINVGEVVPPELERQLVELRQGGGSAGSSGDVAGPTSSTDNAIVRFDGTTGKVVQNSVVTIADTTGNMAGVGTFNASGLATLTSGAVVQGMTVGLGSGAVATNTAVGFGALLFNINGLGNSAVGFETLRYNTTGSSNTATGTYALNSNSNGAGNTANGSTALQYNTLGDNNVATGASALQYNTSGSFNTAAGYEALRNTTGSRSTAIGWQALVSYTPPVVTAGSFVIATAYTIVTVGTTNFVAIGASANTVGVVFTATGAGSGTGTASTNVDATNTALGYGAGSTITTGTKNTIIGAYSGNQGGLDIRTASNYVVLSDGDGNPRAYWNGANATFGGSLTLSTSVIGGATMAVFNTVSTTVNAFGAATALNIGAATGTLTVANTTLAAKAITATTRATINSPVTTSGRLVVRQNSDANQYFGLIVESNAVPNILALGFNGTNWCISPSFETGGAYKDVAIFSNNSKVAEFLSTGLEVAGTLSATGDITSTTGNVVIGTAGKGIDFSATSSGSGTMTSELLADYEEGTWTPSLGGTTTYTAQQATYTKVGRAVYFTAYIVVNLIGTGSTTVITGLPFATAITSNFVNSARAELSATNIVSLAMIAAGTQIILLCRTAASTSDGTSAIAQNGSTIEVNGFYFV